VKSRKELGGGGKTVLEDKIGKLIFSFDRGGTPEPPKRERG